MISTVLVNDPWVTTLSFLTAVVVGPVAAYWLVARPQLARWLGLVSIIPVAALTLVPVQRDLDTSCALEWSFPTFGAVELMANLVLFVPPVLLLGVAFRRPAIVCLGASGASALIEGIQAVIPALGRSCSTNDWLANTLGSLLGGAIAAFVLWLPGAKEGVN